MKEIEKLRNKNAHNRAKRETREAMNPSLHCMNVLECKHIKCTRGVHQYIAAKGCPVACECPEFKSLIGKIYKDVCEYWNLQETDTTDSLKHHEF